MIRAERVAVDLGGRAVLDGVDLEVVPGEVVALVGPNGAGKSTLLAVLSGDRAAASGRIVLDGDDLDDWRVDDLARRRAVMLQEHRLSFPFTVGDVVRMGRAPWRGLPEEDDDETVVARALAATDVAHLGTRTFPTLSGGEKARTSFARVLAQGAGLLLLDEPTAALDIGHQERVLTLVRELAAQGHAVVVVLHDLSLAAAYADRVCLLSGGRVRACGTPADVLDADVLSEVYGHPVEVFAHPVSGDLVVLPRRFAAQPTRSTR
ncbi:heme ABC transporter ATP-binding protein [Solicola sp. PLA-1-18]|uniref:heme ABC transporter ATP-binding protein n=1 Tax=Solicola sp. PLA-1-18 TaxID=3380532 RepID=UPI003B7B87CB